MRGLLVAAACALGCALLVAAPAHAQEATGPLTALVDAGAPLVPPSPTVSGAGVPVAPAAPAASATTPSSGETAEGGGGLPFPAQLFGGLDPRSWAGDVLDGVITALGRALIEAIRDFVDWALGLGDSSLNFVTRTPAAGSYESTTVRSLWELSRGVANAGLAVVVMWGGFNVIVREHIRSPYHGAMELLPRVILAALAVNLTLALLGLAGLLVATALASGWSGVRGLAGHADDAQSAGGRLVMRQNEAASTRRFHHDGRGAWIRPDGSGMIEVGRDRLPLLLEYDRGTLDGGDLAAKLGGYRRYFAAEAWRQDFEAAPVLLFVCADDRAERRVAAAAYAAAPDIPLRITTEWRYTRDRRNQKGMLGQIWRDQRRGERRSLLPGAVPMHPEQGS